MPGKTKCSKCGRKLTDPVSVALGIGPECRGGSHKVGRMTKHQTRRLRGIYRADAFCRGNPVVISSSVIFRRDDKGWSSDGEHHTGDADFKKWLEQNGLADFKILAMMEENRKS